MSSTDPQSSEQQSSEQPWWKSAVVYQIYPRSFADSDGDGIGDLPGVISRLDHLHRLGVDVLWLSPVYTSPQADNGYDISDYRNIDPLFGTLEDLDALVAGLHERGMKLVMDLVVNHSSDEHPWFVESASSRDNAKHDWYIWRDGRDGAAPGAEGAEPNNWGAFFGGSAWQWHEGRGQYYLHLFDRKQPDLNWENPDVRAAVHDMMRWWLDRGVDGFRMDVINFISKVDGLPDAPHQPGQKHILAFDQFANGPRIHDYLAEMRREVFGGRDGQFLTVGEMPGVTPEQAVLYTDPERAEVDMVFKFLHVGVDTGPIDKFDYIGLDLVVLKASLNRWQTALAERGWNSLYWNNHDQPRVVSRFGDDDPAWWRASATALATVLHGMRGTPYVYQGEEIGMTNYPFASAEDHRDVEAVNYFASVPERGIDVDVALAGLAKISRDNARTPMQWDATPHAGFTTGEPWLRVNSNHTWLNVVDQVDDPESVFSHYRRLIELRHTMPIFAEGDFTPLWEDDPALWGYVRSAGGERMLVVANCGREPREVDLGAAGAGSAEPGGVGGSGWTAAELLLGNLPGAADPVLDGASVSLAGWEARIYLAR
ncbi:MAG: glycoside hydrolase family 13 protein [Nocardioides sp.]